MPKKKLPPIEWKNVTVPLGKIKPWVHNPRESTEADAAGINESLEAFNQSEVLLIGPQFELYDGHQRLPVMLKKYGPAHKAACRQSNRALTEEERRKLAIFLHGHATGRWNWDALGNWNPKELTDWGFDKDMLKNWKQDTNALSAFLQSEAEIETEGKDSEVEPELAEELLKKWKVKPGDVWVLGDHKIICGDSTDPKVLASLMGKDLAVLLHADPPYGMGKEGEGVENDNLYREKLDRFQMQWWRACRPFVVNNGSAYIWGNSDDLYRLWFVGGLKDSEKLELRNEIVWDKKSVTGMKSDLMMQYPMATERCLFIMFGEQFIGNLNSDQYWEGWDEIRVPLQKEAERAGLTPRKVMEITGVGMYSHWFSKSQWQMINREYYQKLQEALPGFFLKDHEEIYKRYREIKGGFNQYINGIQGGMRAYFDNGHSIMRDVWEFDKVYGEERYGHATPKPLGLTERCVKSSSPEGAIVLEPFSGSGTTIIACENLNRKCRSIELKPEYVAVALERWSRVTGGTPMLEGKNGKRKK